MNEWAEIHNGLKHQYVIKNMQEMGIDKYRLSEKHYYAYEEAVDDIEEGCDGCFRVWCKFDNPGHIDRSIRHKAVSQLAWRSK